MTSGPNGPPGKKRPWMPDGDQVLKGLFVYTALAGATWSTISVIQWLFS